MKKKHIEKKFQEDVDIKEEMEEVTIKKENDDFVGVKEEFEDDGDAWNDYEGSSDPQENHEFDGVKEEAVEINDEEIVVWNEFEGSSNDLENDQKINYCIPRANLSVLPRQPRQSWSKDDMIEAIKKVRANQMPLKRASKAFKVPRTTLRRLAAEITLSPEDLVHRKLGRKPAIPEEIEKELVEYLLHMENAYHCLTRKDVRKLAYELAERYNVEHPFNNETAGRAWLDSFLKRHEIISLRTPALYARAEGFPSTSKTTSVSPRDLPGKKVGASNSGRKRSAPTIISASPHKKQEEAKNSKENIERGQGIGQNEETLR